MLNVFCWYASASLSNLASASLSNPTSASLSNPTSTSLSNRWITAVFPRKVHRPSQFFAEGEEYMMISPGAIDMAGVLVLPRKEDFEKITKEIIEDVMAQVSLSIKN
jgi:hypothetical protein